MDNIPDFWHFRKRMYYALVIFRLASFDSNSLLYVILDDLLFMQKRIKHDAWLEENDGFECTE